MRLSLILLTTMSLTACTQDAAQISQKGHMFFSQNGPTQVAYVPPKLHSYQQPAYTSQYSTVHTPSVSSQNLERIESKPLATQEQWHSPRSNQQQTITTSRASNSSFIPPVEADIASGYGKRHNGSVNDGINYQLPAGEPVYASANGKVAYVGSELKSYGHMVIIKHAGGYNTSYAHLGRATVAKDSIIQQGQIIGYVGQSGNVTRPQLHFAIRKGSDPVDPNTMLSKQIAGY